ncbi:ureidoglycolate hydrolase [Paraburkholderia sp. 1N]|uniref:Ureidoglycolate hydrolase n=1 Tax=Paraburkholderia solitsugae TaxID=2675748 RepID=A0ABX2C040_9BURK|nr:ureidoglycolate lyase [Paraburkholderia solitsugae]NPT46442.1 ureidoglycolate hydrolase [Paraburkholderia solitsugae]
MSTAPLLTVKQLTPASFSPFGWVLGKAMATAGDKPFFKGATLSMWREHLFDTGAPNETEIVWGSFSDDDPIVRTLETRLLTQQAVVPLTGPLIQIVAASNESGGPDIDSIRAFEIPIGMGTFVRPGCWHAIRVSKGEVMALLLSRQSTTYDLIVHLHTGCPTAESSRNSIVPRRVVLREVESNEIVDVA